MSLPIPFPGQSKNILLVGDEGIVIYNVTGGGIRFIDQLAWLTPDFEVKLVDTLKRDCPRRPIVILYDMVEQHYRKEMVPKVSIVDKSNVIKRKVAITFPNFKMRSAMALQASKAKGEGKGLKSSPYLFAAVPSSELISSLLRAVVASGLPISGLYLLPIEGVGLISKIVKKLPNHKQKSRWTLFMGQHGSGSLRQIVTKDGELALTRMTPFSESQENTEAWAQSMFQEYKVTISYLTRLGYDAKDGIDIVMVSPDGANEDIERYFLEETVNMFALTVNEAASLAGVKVNVEQEEEFADVLYVAWAGQTMKYTLPLPVDSFEKATRPRLVANALLFVALAGCGWFGYQAAINSMSYLSIRSELGQRQSDLKKEKAQYALLLDEKEKEGYDIRLYKGAFAAEEELNSYALKPFEVLKKVSYALGPVLSIDDIVIRHGENDEIHFENLNAVPKGQGNNFGEFNQPAQNNGEGYQLYSRMSMTFSASVPQEEAQLILTNLVRELQDRLPDYQITIAKAVRDRNYDVDVEGRIGAQNSKPELETDNTAVIEIRGAV